MRTGLKEAPEVKQHADRYLDLKTLAEYSSLSVRTLRQYLSDPDNPIPFFTLKRKILVKQSEFDSWMERFRTDINQLDKTVDEILYDFQQTPNK